LFVTFAQVPRSKPGMVIPDEQTKNGKDVWLKGRSASSRNCSYFSVRVDGSPVPHRCRRVLHDAVRTVRRGQAAWRTRPIALAGAAFQLLFCVADAVEFGLRCSRLLEIFVITVGIYDNFR
jgi:hypothetical protein